jgi:hypothetical protein
MTKQTLLTNPGRSPGPADLEGFRLLMALQTSESEINLRDKNSEDCERRRMAIGQ